MSRKNKRKKKPADGDAENVSAGGWMERDRNVRWRKFPGPGGVDEPLRVAFSRAAYADIVSHAKQNLDAEVCGVLAGEFCEDEQGEYVSVLAAVAGAATEQDTSHVTFTQETWNQIHQQMERDHPKLRIVGWYHSHPGFGVSFSDMDLFIQENFFSGKGQIALVMDPLGGEESICLRGRKGIEHVSSFWVEGRQRRCRVPPGTQSASGRSPRSGEVAKAIESVEARLGQALQAVEDLRAGLHRFLLAMGMLVALAVVFWIGKAVYEKFASSSRPPEVQAFQPGPVKIGNRWRWIGATLVTRELAPELEQKLIEAEIQQLEAARAKKDKKGPAAPRGAVTKPARTQPAAGR